MNKNKEILELCLKIVDESLKKLIKKKPGYHKKFYFSKQQKKEMKSELDFILEKFIINKLLETKISIISEESGSINSNKNKHLKLIIDPLDGTINFHRNLGPSAISVALFENGMPSFGILGLLPSNCLVWGGKEYGSWFDGKKINVSKIKDPFQAVVCTGFPNEFDLNKPHNLKGFIKTIKKFGKVRMLGSAANSLLMVAKGSSELYFEKSIKIWDVAAGLAIVEGAGGKINIKSLKEKGLYDIVASNGKSQIYEFN